MTGKGHILSADQVSERYEGHTRIQLITDAPQKLRAVYILPQTSHPMPGDYIEWDTGHVYWQGRKIAKKGYSFDPDEPLR